MELYILMAQRKCAYEGQYAPEALSCMSGPEYDDNPDYLQNERYSNIETGEFEAVKIVTIIVDSFEIERRMFPARDPVQATCA